jgi:LysM repeat protein
MLEQKNRSRARVRLAVFFVLSIHVIGLMALLMQGCRKNDVVEQPPVDTNTVQNAMPTLDTNNLPPATTMPTATNPPTPVYATQNPQTYTIAAGDTLTTIAKKFPGVTIKAILDANPGVEPTRLHVGQVLHIPAPAAPANTITPATPTQGAAAAAEGEQMYTVQSGDNLTKIAEKFKTTVRALRSANNLTTDQIKVGQKLKIPAHTAPPAPMASPAHAGSSHTAA